jgi:hypothetical protein
MKQSSMNRIILFIFLSMGALGLQSCLLDAILPNKDHVKANIGDDKVKVTNVSYAPDSLWVIVTGAGNEGLNAVTLTLTITEPDRVGTHELDSFNMRNAFTYMLVGVDGAKSYRSFEGSIEVTKSDDEGMEGTFSGKVTSALITQTVGVDDEILEVKDGSFKVSYE